MGDEDELEKLFEEAGEGAKNSSVALNVLKSAPEGGVRPRVVKEPMALVPDEDGDQEVSCFLSSYARERGQKADLVTDLDEGRRNFNDDDDRPHD